MALLRRKLTKGPCSFPCSLPSGRVAFFDVPFTMVVSKIYIQYLKDLEYFNWSSELSDYYFGILPKCETTNKELRVDIDNVYVVLNIKNIRWIALDISFLHNHIDVYDNITSISSDKEIIGYVKPYTVMFPNLIKALVSPSEQGYLIGADLKVTRHKGIPQNKQTGDYGVYAIKYIKCLAFGADMKIGLCDSNIEDIRKKLATDIFAGANHYDDL